MSEFLSEIDSKLSNNETVNIENIPDDALWDILDNIGVEETNEDEEDKNVCSNCKSKNLLTNASKGYIVCQDCGELNESLLDRNPEWQSSDGKEGASRCGCPTNYYLPKSSLGTKIGGRGYSRLKILQKWGQMTYKERSLYEVLLKIEDKCKKYNITKPIIENAKILFKQINDSKHLGGENIGKNIIIRGFNRESLIASCVFYGAIKQENQEHQKK